MAQQLDLFPTDIYLTRINTDKNMHRYYALVMEQTLFGEFVVVRQWGRIGSYGRQKRQWFSNGREALSFINDYTATKQKRGYALS